MRISRSVAAPPVIASGSRARAPRHSGAAVAAVAVRRRKAHARRPHRRAGLPEDVPTSGGFEQRRAALPVAVGAVLALGGVGTAVAVTRRASTGTNSVHARVPCRMLQLQQPQRARREHDERRRRRGGALHIAHSAPPACATARWVLTCGAVVARGAERRAAADGASGADGPRPRADAAVAAVAPASDLAPAARPSAAAPSTTAVVARGAAAVQHVHDQPPARERLGRMQLAAHSVALVERS